jgi:hypothetical protein
MNDELNEFLAELSLRLEDEGFEISYNELSRGEPLAVGSDGGDYMMSVTEYENSLEVILSGPADFPEGNYLEMPSFSDVLDATGEPSYVDIRTNGDRYFATAEVDSLQHVEDVLDELAAVYRGLSEL